MKKTCTRILLLLLVVVFFSGCFGKSGSVDMEQINKVIDNYEKSILTKDATLLADQFHYPLEFEDEQINRDDLLAIYTYIFEAVEEEVKENKVYEREIVISSTTATAKGKIKQTLTGYDTAIGTITMQFKKINKVWKFSDLVDIAWQD